MARVVSFPSIKDVVGMLRAIAADFACEAPPTDDNDDDSGWIDVRLQVHDDGGWKVHCGDSSWDQDHRGHWGASAIPVGGKRFNAVDVARDLIEQARDSAAQSDDASAEGGAL